MIAKDVVKSLVILTSDYCNEAVDEIIKLASSGISKTKVYLKYLEDTDPSMDLFLEKEDFDQKKGRAQDIYDKQSKRITYAGLDVEILKPHFGIASEEVLRLERQLGLDIIIIAAPKRSIYRRILYGAHFSTEVARKAKTPTLVVEPSSAGRILVACPQQ